MMDDQLIRAQAGEAGWEQRAAAHAAFFTVLAEAAAGDPAATALLASGGELARELMITAGRGCDGIVVTPAAGSWTACAAPTPAAPRGNWKTTWPRSGETIIPNGSPRLPTRQPKRGVRADARRVRGGRWRGRHLSFLY
jgi:hypothetical protein